ncbi:MAG: AIM24 family protein, partial [Bacillota bacterium]|nr:AIM24 family protein [Bacillota bacterium]
MKYRIIGSVVPAVEILFDESGESIYTQSGGMTWMSEHIEMETNTRGGLLKGLGRVFTGESLFMVTFTSKKPNESISFAATAPGCIHLLDIGKNGNMIIAKGCFLCAQETVNMKVAFTKKFSAGMFGGEGFVLQELSGSGIAFLEVAGDLVE